MTVRRSQDDGQTWPLSTVVHPGGSAYSCMTEMSDKTQLGLLHERDAQGCRGPSCQTVFSVLPLSLKTDDAAVAAEEHTHRGGGLTSGVMASIISKLPPVTANSSGVRDGKQLMRTVRLSGDYQADVPLLLPSFTRLVLDGTITAVPYKLSWTPGSAGSPNMTAAIVSAKGAQMVSVEGGSWSCAGWNSSASQGNSTDVTAIYFDETSFSFIRNLRVSRCGMYAGGNNSSSIGVGRIACKIVTLSGFVVLSVRLANPQSATIADASGNIRIDGGHSNVVENVESSYSTCRGIWAQTQKLVVAGGRWHHNNADGIDLDSASSHCTVYNNTCFMNGRHGVFLEEGASFNT